MTVPDLAEMASAADALERAQEEVDARRVEAGEQAHRINLVAVVFHASGTDLHWIPFVE